MKIWPLGTAAQAPTEARGPVERAPKPLPANLQGGGAETSTREEHLASMLRLPAAATEPMEPCQLRAIPAWTIHNTTLTHPLVSRSTTALCGAETLSPETNSCCAAACCLCPAIRFCRRSRFPTAFTSTRKARRLRDSAPRMRVRAKISGAALDAMHRCVATRSAGPWTRVGDATATSLRAVTPTTSACSSSIALSWERRVRSIRPGSCPIRQHRAERLSLRAARRAQLERTARPTICTPASTESPTAKTARYAMRFVTRLQCRAQRIVASPLPRAPMLRR